MSRASVLLATAALAACAGAPLTTSRTGSSPNPVPDVFDCVRGQFKALGFDQTSIDTKDYRLTARKFSEGITRPDVNFRRLVHRLEVEVAPGGGGAMTTLSVDARTFEELVTQRGPTEVQEHTATEASAAADSIIARCGSA